MEQYADTKNTIIYGGAFNPPTRAHQAILQACIDQAETIDADVWVLPSGERADKTIETPRERRIAMLNALSKDVIKRNVELHIDTSELDRVERTETYDTVREFDETHPDRRFIWVFGSDSVETMPIWHHGEWLMDNLPMLIVERPGTPIRQLGALATKLPVDTVKTSSTEVRDRLRHRLPVDHLVPPNVMAELAPA